MSTKAFFPFGGGPNLVLGIGRKNQIFFLRTPAAVKFFHRTIRKMITLMLKKIITHSDEFVQPICGPLHYFLGEF